MSADAPAGEAGKPETAIAKTDVAAIERRERDNLLYAKERKRSAVRHGVVFFIGAGALDVILRLILNELFGIGYYIPLTSSLVVLFGLNRFVAHPVSAWIETMRDNMPEVWKARKDKQIVTWATRRALFLETLATGLGYHDVNFQEILPDFPVYLRKWRSIKADLEKLARLKAGYGTNGTVPEKISNQFSVLEKRRERIEESIQRFMDSFGEIEAKIIMKKHADIDAYGAPEAVADLDRQIDREEEAMQAGFAELDEDLSLDKKLDALMEKADADPRE